jgi:YbgC/YbaW family acyl-CoA thioester hydrolase
MSRSEPFRFQARIRFIDTDASGRIHYTSMFRYFESAEIEFMRSLGLTYLESDFAFPRVHVECDFKLALRLDDVIDIEVCLTRLGTSSARYDFKTYKGEELAAFGTIVVACVERKTGRSIPIPQDLRARLEGALTLTGNQ